MVMVSEFSLCLYFEEISDPTRMPVLGTLPVSDPSLETQHNPLLCNNGPQCSSRLFTYVRNPLAVLMHERSLSARLAGDTFRMIPHYSMVQIAD